ncbi:patatin-like phospholipase family protein [Peribacillus sp. SCS-37]|uniref:patatin-like phospholipase family protein n=1 Tax=Paraperibacillus esterisolvens TaxID=3115296 RepID=UPI003906A7C1
METGLAFAGGGIPGCAAVGVLRAFKECGIKVTHVTGTSSGAIAAALYAYGYEAQDLEEIVPALSRRYLDVDYKAVMLRALFLKPHINGWLKGNRLRNLVGRLTDEAPLSSMKLPCGIVATDLEKGQPFVFTQSHIPDFDYDTDALISDAVRASFAIPLVFKPWEHKGQTLIDGGVTVNCPVQVCRALGAKKVIAIDPITPIAKIRGHGSGTYRLMHKIIYLNLQLQMEIENKYADYVLMPETGFVGGFEFKKAVHCIEAGYQAAMKNMEAIESKLTDA